MAKKAIISNIDGHQIKLTNLDKVLYPSISLIKAELIQYYINISPYILPHLSKRPLTLIRYPDGIDNGKFYSKNSPSWKPPWISTTQIEESDDNEYITVNHTAALAWVANLAALELHPMQIRSSNYHSPDQFILDLDPPEDADFATVKNLALRLKTFLESRGYNPYLKTSGSKGLHIYVPIHPAYSQEVLIDAIKKLAKDFLRSDPTTTLRLNKEKRKGKILLDIYRNHKSQTCVAPYSTRGIVGAPISTPIYWDELESIASSQQYHVSNIMARLENKGDPWADFYDRSTVVHTDKSTSVPVATHTTPDIVDYDNIGRLIEPSAKDLNTSYVPMLADMSNKIPSTEYIYEIKWDGIRAIISKVKKVVKITSRNGNDITSKFPQISALVNNIQAESIVLDGEIVVLNKKGKPDFGKVISRLHRKTSQIRGKPIGKDIATFYGFDCLLLNQRDLTAEPLEVRRQCLSDHIPINSQIRMSEAFTDGRQLFGLIEKQGMEGIICKKKGSNYQVGHRSKNWLKVKVRHVDAAIVIGYTEGKGDRSGSFGALHLAKLEKENWIYFGKVGTGFDQKKRNQIFQKVSNLQIITKPISNLIADESSTYWIEPIYSCNLHYASMTANGTYREPVFIKLTKTSS